MTRPAPAPSPAVPVVDARLAAIALMIAADKVRVARAAQQDALSRMKASNDPDERVMVPRDQLEALEDLLLWVKGDDRADDAWETVRRWLGKPID